MPNPFERRATEYLRDDEAFLSVVTPEPLTTYFEQSAKNRTLYDKLTVIVGNPGSGKTTLARLFEFKTLATLLRNRELPTYKSLMQTLTACNAIEDSLPAIVGARIPLESEYRDFWEFPYTDELKLSLLTALLQARAVLGWFRNLAVAGVHESSITVNPRPNADAAADEIGGVSGEAVLRRAREVERSVYRISAALIPPPPTSITGPAASAYRPFDVIESLTFEYDGVQLTLPVLVVLDDAHSLHRDQLDGLTRWLARRELRVSRWLITRLDALTPSQVLEEPEDAPGLSVERDILPIRLQSGPGGSARIPFRKMSRDMAGRYLRQMDVFQRRSIRDLGDILSTSLPAPPRSRVDEASRSIDAAARRLKVPETTVASLRAEVDSYFSGSRTSEGEDLRVECLRILMHRYARRNTTPSLLIGLEDDDTSPDEKIPAMSSGVVEGARVHLLHSARRPLFYGLDAISDASSENAELFLRLCGRLVAQSETQLVRGKPASLTPETQDRLLRERGRDIVSQWDFPRATQVRRLADTLAKRCLAKSLEDNASLGGGASAFGVPEEQFARIAETHEDLAEILKYGVAYTAFEIGTNEAKHRKWRLVHLGGPVLLKHGITVRRGGFIEGTVDDLLSMINGPDQ